MKAESFKVAAVFMALAVSGCWSRNDLERNELMDIPIPSGAVNVQRDIAKGIDGSSEVAVVFQIRTARQGHEVYDFYQEHFQSRGMTICEKLSDKERGGWSEFLDSSGGSSRHMFQLRFQFVGGDQFVDVIVEQEQFGGPEKSSQKPLFMQKVAIRRSSGHGDSCSQPGL